MEQNQGPIAPEGRKPRSNTALLALVVLLLISNIVMLYLLMQSRRQEESTQQKVEQVSNEKDNVTHMLEDMLAQYDTLDTENEQLRTEMEAQKEQITQLLDQVKRGNYSLAKAQKEAATLRKIMKGYVATIDSLNQANLQLTSEKMDLTQQLGEVTGQKEALEDRASKQEELISKGSLLYTTAITAGAVFLRNNGKQVDTQRANKAEMVKCCFTLGENRVTRSGDKTLYMRIISPDGQVLPASEANNRFKFEGVEGEYSAKRDVNYQNVPVDACIFWTANDKMRTGQYIVEIYEAGAKVARTTFDLK
ncbi:MAG: hypothetical protein H6595_07110 [Flavobacteriales bacterium]|nr:hypothetical protein [Flavobacteriales bacterium]MCB9167235.1 hypothetical protein [Flavobacteriales bacterium]MCB9194586.1 hypothetical protein [Flavobacteriales bacterium]